MDQQNNQTPSPAPRRKGFRDLMKRREKIFGWIYLPIHVVLLPLFLSTVLYLVTGSKTSDPLTLNIWYYLIGTVFLFATQFCFFRDSYSVLTHNFRAALLTMVMSWAILMAGNVLLNLLSQLFGSLPSSPNDEAVTEYAQIDMRRMAAAAVIMAPIVEEALFRGLIFGSLREKHLFWAYAVSMVLFSLYHVWQFAVVEQSFTVLLSAAAYLPIAFVLAFCYDRSGSIWTSIFFHMFYNALALSMR